MTLEIGDVLLSRLARVLAGPDGILFGGQTKSVPAHGVQHVQALCALIPRQNIRRGVPLGMADVQAGARRIRKHVEDVEFGHLLWLELLMSSRKRMLCRNTLTGIPGAKSLLLIPVSLPLGFDQVKWILTASRCHRRGNIAKRARPDNALLPVTSYSRRAEGRAGALRSAVIDHYYFGPMGLNVF